MRAANISRTCTPQFSSTICRRITQFRRAFCCELCNIIHKAHAGEEPFEAVAYVRTSFAASVGADKESVLRI